MIRMTNGEETRFVFDSAVRMYRDKGYVVEGEEPVVAVPEVPEEPAVEDTKSDEDAELEIVAPKDEFEVNEDGKYVCPKCGKDYATKANLLKHIEREHKDE